MARPLPSLIDVLAVIIVLSLIATLLFACSPTARISVADPSVMTQLRGIQQSCVIYAQNNKSYYPGINPDGTLGRINVAERYTALVQANMFTPDYLISPIDTGKSPWPGTGPMTTNHYSYAALQVPAAGGRHDEWSETINPQAIVFGDRNTGTVNQPATIWTGHRAKQPRMIFGCQAGTRLAQTIQGFYAYIVANDNSTTRLQVHHLTTQYGSAPANPNDHLFDPAGNDDAYLVYSGN